MMVTRRFTFFIFWLILACFQSCDSSDSELCGVSKRWVSNLGTEPKIEKLDPLSGNRIFTFEDYNVPTDICSDDVSKIEFNIGFFTLPVPQGVKAYGKAYWSTYEKEIPLQPDDNYIENFSIKQAFPGKAGKVNFQIIFEFPTQGSLAADKAYFSTVVKSCTIYYDYFQHI
ncbi:MAG TPA: hypothetical protein PKA12_02025 [Saprospiraceae bacterium]|nr:hypothetical protein [Saprospiraceae bacterium]